MVHAVSSSTNTVLGPAPLRTAPGTAGLPESLRARRAAGQRLDPRDPAVVRNTAAEFLSELFFAPLLAEMRQFPLGGAFLDGGRTEAIFGEQLDQRIADRVALSSGGVLEQVIAQIDAHGKNLPPAGAQQAAWRARLQAAAGPGDTR